MNLSRLAAHFRSYFFIKNLPLVLVSSFFLVLLLLYSHGTYAIDSFTETERQSVVKQIEAMAQRHAKTGSPLKTEVALDVFRQNSAGLTPFEISKIYEDVYEIYYAENKRSLGNILKEYGGWFGAFALFIILIFRDALRRTLSQAADRVFLKFHRRIAHTRFAQRRALRIYLMQTRATYQTLKIPFRPRQPLDLASVFVPLSVHAGPNTETIDAIDACISYKRLVVLGAPGSGKSVLLKTLMLAFGRGWLDRIFGSALAVFIELRRMNDFSPQEIDIHTHVLNALRRSGVEDPEPLLQSVLAPGRGQLILFLDGLDEVDTDRRKMVARRISDYLEEYSSCRAVVTCRTQVYDHEFFQIADETLQILDFLDAQIRQFLDAWADQMPSGKSADQLVATLQDRPRIMALARNPLLLTIIAFLYADTEATLPHSRSAFYRQAVLILLGQWNVIRNDYDPGEKAGLLRHLALVYQQQSAGDARDRLVMPADTVLAHIRAAGPKLNLLDDFDPRALLAEIVERSGLILAVDGGQGYQFSHLTLQEFFAAEALLHDPDRLLSLYEQDRDRWRECVKLWCGLADDCTKVLQAIHAREPLAALECLADARGVDEAVGNHIAETLRTALPTAANDIEAARAIAAVASDTRGNRGRAAFNFLVEKLKAASGAERMAAIETLAATNLEQAARALALTYDVGDTQIRNALIRLGDLSVSSLSALAHDGNEAAVADLGKIGTPRAALALVPLLRKDLGATRRMAAWYLGDLLSLPSVVTRLEREPLPDGFEADPQWLWVWEPFDQSRTGIVRSIVSQICAVIDAIEARDAESLPAQIGSFDRRIMAVLLARRPSFFKMYDTLSVSTESVIPKSSSVPTESVIPQWVKLLIDISPRDTHLPIHALLGRAFADLPKARHSELTSELVAWLNIDAADAFTASLLKAFPASFFYCMSNFGSERTKIENLQFYWKTQFDKIIYKASANIELFLIDLIVSGIILFACFIGGVIFYQHAFSGAYNQSFGFHGYTFILPNAFPGLPVWANAFLCVVGLLSGLLLILFLLRCHMIGKCNTRDARLTTFLPIYGSLVSGPLWLVIALSRSVWKDPSLSWLCIGCAWSYVGFLMILFLMDNFSFPYVIVGVILLSAILLVLHYSLERREYRSRNPFRGLFVRGEESPRFGTISANSDPIIGLGHKDGGYWADLIVARNN